MSFPLKRLSKHIGFTLTVKIVAAFLSLYQLKWLISHASATAYAQYNIASEVVGVIIMFCGFGIYAVLQKEFTNSKNRSYLATLWSTLFFARLGVVIIGAFVTLLLASFFPTVSLTLFLLLFLQSSLTLVDYNYFALYASHSDVWKFTLTDLCGKIFSVLLLIGYEYKLFSISLHDVVIYFVITQCIAAILSLYIDSRINAKRVEWGIIDFSLLQKLLPKLLIVATTWLIMALYQSTHANILQYYHFTEIDINSFKNGLLLVTQAVLALGVLNTQIASVIKQQLDEQKDAKIRKNVFLKYTLFYSAILCLGYIAFVLFTPYVIGFIDRENKYSGALHLLPVLGLFMITNSISGLLYYLNIFFDRETTQLGIAMVVAPASVVLFAMLVPNFGLVGMTWAVILISILELSIRFITLRKHLSPVDNHVSP